MRSMINRIDNNNPYEYPKTQNVNPRRIDTDEKFRLDYGNGTNLSGEDQKESIHKENGDKNAADRRTEEALLRDGIRLELSGQARKARDNANDPGQTTGRADTKQISLWSSLRGILRLAADSVRSFFYRLWYDTPDKEAADLDETPETDRASEPVATLRSDEEGKETESGDATVSAPDTDEPAVTAEELTFHMRSEEARINREVQPYLKSGDLARVVSLLTDNGRKTVAHNSTLLTYYDRNGNVTGPSASDSERILHGDRNVKQL